jgi:hypothetical protein
MSNFIKSYQANVGLNHTPAYQVSGQPFASGSIDGTTGTAVRIQFPYVTRWVQITNHDGSNELTASFSQAGLSGGNHFKIHEAESSGKASGYSPVLELKVSEMWFTGSADFDVVAGLTSIPASRTTTADGTSWSGSAGVG